MKKTKLALTIVSGLVVSLVAGTQFVSLAGANPLWLFDFTAPPYIRLDSPVNKTYSGNVLLSFTVIATRDWVKGIDDFPEIYQMLNSVDYYIDGSFRGSIVADSNLSHPFRFSAYLTDLHDGSHCLMVETNSTGVKGGYAMGNRVYRVPANSSSVTVYFSIVGGASPSPTPVSAPTLTTSATPEPTATRGIKSQPDSISATLVMASVSVIAVFACVALFSKTPFRAKQNRIE